GPSPRNCVKTTPEGPAGPAARGGRWEPSWEPSARTTSPARRTGTDRRLAIMPARGRGRAAPDGPTGIYGAEGWGVECLRARPRQTGYRGWSVPSLPRQEYQGYGDGDEYWRPQGRSLTAPPRDDVLRDQQQRGSNPNNGEPRQPWGRSLPDAESSQ